MTELFNVLIKNCRPPDSEKMKMAPEVQRWKSLDVLLFSFMEPSSLCVQWGSVAQVGIFYL